MRRYAIINVFGGGAPKERKRIFKAFKKIYKTKYVTVEFDSIRLCYCVEVVKL